MTHEDPYRSYPEHRHGPEHDHSLPDATTIPEFTDVERSLAPPLTVLEVPALGPEYVGAEPGWWGASPEVTYCEDPDCDGHGAEN